ncbi:MAG: hypothetical protein ACYSWS_06305 [Planctomycetota bacterium]|jgi:hypothetical protein
MIRKYIVYIVVVVVLLIAWYYRTSIKDSLVHSAKDVRKNVNAVRKASPFTDDRLEGEVKKAMGR